MREVRRVSKRVDGDVAGGYSPHDAPPHAATAPTPRALWRRVEHPVFVLLHRRHGAKHIGRVERSGGDGRLEQRSAAFGVGGKKGEGVGEMPLGPRPVGGKALGEKNALDRVELPVGPRLEIDREIVFEEPVIDERPLLLRLQSRHNDRAEERRILLEQEQIQLVAGMLGIELLLLHLVELRPSQQKRKRRQIGALRQRPVECIDLREAVISLEPAGGDIGQLEVFSVCFPRLDERHFLLLDEVFLSIERRAEPQVGKQRGRGGEGHAAQQGLRRIDDDDRHLLMNAKLLKLDPDRAVVGRHEVRQDKPTISEKVEIGEALRRARSRSLGLIGCRRHARRRRLGTREIISRLGVLLDSLRVIDGPGMEKEARPVDHRPGIRSLPTAAENVTDFVAKISAADIGRGGGPLGIDPRLSAADLRKTPKRIEIGRHPRGDDVNPRERI